MGRRRGQREAKVVLTVTLPDGRELKIPEEEYAQRRADGEIPDGSYVQRSDGGWSVAGASLWDIFDD